MASVGSRVDFRVLSPLLSCTFWSFGCVYSMTNGNDTRWMERTSGRYDRGCAVDWPRWWKRRVALAASRSLVFFLILLLFLPISSCSWLVLLSWLGFAPANERMPYRSLYRMGKRTLGVETVVRWVSLSTSVSDEPTNGQQRHHDTTSESSGSRRNAVCHATLRLRPAGGGPVAAAGKPLLSSFVQVYQVALRPTFLLLSRFD